MRVEVGWGGESALRTYVRMYVPVRVCFVSNASLFQSHKRQVKERDGLVVSLAKQLSLKGTYHISSLSSCWLCIHIAIDRLHL